MHNIRMIPPVIIGHMDRETSLRQAGDFTLLGDSVNQTVRLADIFGVKRCHDLLVGIVALLRMSDIRRLGLSLDYIADHPACVWTLAVLVRPVNPGTTPNCFARFCSWIKRCLSTPLSPPNEPRNVAQDYPFEVEWREKAALIEKAASREPQDFEEEKVGSDIKNVEGENLLLKTRARMLEELRQRTAARIAGVCSRAKPISLLKKQPKPDDMRLNVNAAQFLQGSNTCSNRLSSSVRTQARISWARSGQTSTVSISKQFLQRSFLYAPPTMPARSSPHMKDR